MRTDNYKADEVVNEGRFAVQSLATQLDKGPKDPGRVDAENRAWNAVQAIAHRSDTRKVLEDAGISLQSAKSDLANGRLDKLTQAFESPTLGTRRSYGPAASERAPTAMDYWRLTAQFTPTGESSLASAREGQAATATNARRPGLTA